MAETVDSTIEKLLKLKSRLGSVPLWTLQHRHELGSALQEACKPKGEAGRYGAKLMHRLSEALEMDGGVLNKHRQFAASFNAEELAHLVGVHLPNGKPLVWSHVRLLTEVKGKKQRARLIEQTAAKGWTSAKLEAAIRDIKGEKTRGGGPRPIAPGNLLDLIQQMSQLLGEWENRHEQVWSKPEHSLAGLAKALPRRQAKEKTIKMLEALREEWSRAATRSGEMVKDVDRAIDQLREKGNRGDG